MEINRAALVSDVELYLKTYAMEYAKSASVEFPKLAKKTIIDVFYGSYSPDYYIRTNDLMENSYYKYFKDNGTTAYGGVIISSRDMSDYLNNWGNGIYSVTSAADVASWTWLKGYHGYLGGDPSNAIYTFPPIGSLEIEIGSILPRLNESASKKAKSQSYQVLQF